MTSNFENSLAKLLSRVREFEKNAHGILGTHEESASRVVELGATYERLNVLSVPQDELFRQALRCVEGGLFRAAHVMGWAAFMDYLESRLSEDGLTKVNSVRPKWKLKSEEDMRERVNEYQLIDVAREVGLCNKSQSKALHGMLNKRNECAHPSDFFPGLNEALGYMSEIFNRIDQISRRSL